MWGMIKRLRRRRAMCAKAREGVREDKLSAAVMLVGTGAFSSSLDSRAYSQHSLDLQQIASQIQYSDIVLLQRLRTKHQHLMLLNISNRQIAISPSTACPNMPSLGS